MRFLSVLCLILAVTYALPHPAAAENADGVTLTCLNIGKADCLILQAGEEAYLIDTGYERTYPALATALKELGITALEGVFMTHCHKDHMGGLLSLAQSDIPVNGWYAAAYYYNTDPEEHPILAAAAVRNEEPRFLYEGDFIPLKNGDGTWGFKVLGPLMIDEENENNNSLVMRFACPWGSILLTGDMKLEEEETLLNRGLFEKTDVLKAAHHGDNKASGEEMLAIVRPKVTLISTSTAEEGDTPAPSTLKRLADVGSQVYVTQDASDAWQVRLDGEGITVADIAWPGIPAAVSGISMAMDINEDVIALSYHGTQTVTLEGAMLYSTKGEDAYDLPAITLKAGQTYLIGSKSTDREDCDLYLEDKKIWHKSKRDVAILYDAWGRALARCDNGMEEE